MKTKMIDLKDIEQNENSRAVYKEIDLSELMSSMKLHGLLQPVGVMPTKNGKYEAVYGNRRIVAARKLGWADIGCVVIDLQTENERDLLGLVENMKRQNTSVVEEGRMYQVLVSRGLTVKEIAARLDSHVTRIETALDAVANVPAEFAKTVVNAGSNRQTPKGKISATAYYTLAQARKRHGLNRPKFRKLLQFAQSGSATVQHLEQIAPLVSKGSSVEEALQTIKSYDRVALHLLVERRVRERIEKKTGGTYTAWLMAQLGDIPGSGIQKRPGGADYRTKTRLRKAGA